MSDLAAGEDMEWEQSVILTPEQVNRLNHMKEKAVRLRRAKHQQKVFREEVAKKLETKCKCNWSDNPTHISTSDNYNCNVNFNCSDTNNCSDTINCSDLDDNSTKVKTTGLCTGQDGDPENPGDCALM